MAFAWASACIVALAAPVLELSARDYEGPTEVSPSAPAEPIVAPTPAPQPEPPPPLEPATTNAETTRKIVVTSRHPPSSERDRASSVVSREELDERMPRSTPDALRGEPGVFVQQTAHGQASPYIRGLTGQQTVMMFDGVRLNNSTFRQGPNQYFFTIDSRSVEQIEVVRGSSSTRWGSDALGGAILVTPKQPQIDANKRVSVHPRGIIRTATADAEIGGRAQTSLSFNGKVGLLAGVGYRDVDLLRSGGRVIEPQTGMPQTVPPLFGPDGKTQLGTGFRELTDDARLVWQPNDHHRFTLGYYDYRQFDVPRTDKCPPRTAPQDECLTYEEQFRTLAYGGYDLYKGPAAAETVTVRVSYQNQHEKRLEDRGSPSTTQLTGDDDVHSGGLRVQIDTKDFVLAPWATLGVRYGADAYLDTIDSRARLTFTDVDVSIERPRGQYLDGAKYVTSGAWTELHTEFADAVRLKAGGRAAFVAAQAAGEPMTASERVDNNWFSAVGNTGIAADAVDWLTFVFNVDQGFRAPNLDDLTSRQQVGPGYQYENANLRPEKSLTLETGALASHRWFQLQAFGYRTAIRDFIQRQPQLNADCPEGDTDCAASNSPLQLTNLDGTALVWGAEGKADIFIPFGFSVSATVSYAWGEGPNPVAFQPMQPDRVPLSRIPPLNGVGEIGWRKYGVHIAGVVRWARAQTRLAPQDRVDARIPRGGTPGFVTFDILAGYRFHDQVLAGLVFENVGDAPYKHHGSSVNGPGRGLMVELQFGF